MPAAQGYSRIHATIFGSFCRPWSLLQRTGDATSWQLMEALERCSSFFAKVGERGERVPVSIIGAFLDHAARGDQLRLQDTGGRILA